MTEMASISAEILLFGWKVLAKISLLEVMARHLKRSIREEAKTLKLGGMSHTSIELIDNKRNKVDQEIGYDGP